jgi:hypothetical protein
MPVPQTSAELVGTFIEAVAYGTPSSYYRVLVSDSRVLEGAYVMVFLDCMGVLRKKGVHGASGAYLLGTAIALFVLVTAVRHSLSHCFVSDVLPRSIWLLT